MTKIARHGRMLDTAPPHGRADGGRHGDDERTDAHQSSDLAAWGLFENDVHHQRCGHAGADALDDAGY